MGGWSDKTKLILISTLVKVVVEGEVELGNIFKPVLWFLQERVHSEMKIS